MKRSAEATRWRALKRYLRRSGRAYLKLAGSNHGSPAFAEYHRASREFTFTLTKMRELEQEHPTASRKGRMTPPTELERLCALQVTAARAVLDVAKLSQRGYKLAVLTAIDRLSDNGLAAKLDAVTYPPKDRD